MPVSYGSYKELTKRQVQHPLQSEMFKNVPLVFYPTIYTS